MPWKQILGVNTPEEVILPNSHLQFGSSFGIQVVRAVTREGIWYECPGYYASPSHIWLDFKVIREPSLQTYSCACLCFWVPPFNPYPCHLPSWRVNTVFSAEVKLLPGPELWGPLESTPWFGTDTKVRYQGHVLCVTMCAGNYASVHSDVDRKELSHLCCLLFPCPLVPIGSALIDCDFRLRRPLYGWLYFNRRCGNCQ